MVTASGNPAESRGVYRCGLSPLVRFLVVSPPGVFVMKLPKLNIVNPVKWSCDYTLML